MVRQHQYSYFKMTIERVLSFYGKNHENLVKEILLEIPVEVLRVILESDQEDENVFNIYHINQNQFELIKKIVPALSELEFDLFDVYYECFQI
jgi:hypothetical protein